MLDPEQVVEIRDPEIDVEEIMERIRERIRQRRAEAQAQGLDYDRLPAAGASFDTSDRRLNADLYYDLYQARQSADGIWIPLSVVGRSVPVIGPLVARLRRAAHTLVLYYVNMLAGRQVIFNRSAASVLSGLAAALEERDAKIDRLEDELAALRHRIADLEGQEVSQD